MQTLRSNLSVVMVPAPDDDGYAELKDCTPKQELFAQAWAKTGNKAAAYRMAYNVHERTLPNVIWVSASRVAALPQVIARYRVLIEQSALETIMSVRELFQWTVDVATADPSEIAWVVARNCRHCHGVGHKYQWKDEDEYMKACIEALDTRAMPPLDDGGYGFNGALEPVATCAICFGVGFRQTVVADTSTLKGKARKLYAGAEQDRFGVVKVKMHDQKAYHEMACRMLGAFNDKLDLRTPEERAKASERARLPENLTADEASKAYLQLLS